METESTTSPDPVAADRPDWIRMVTAAAAGLMIVLLGAVLLVQIDVTDAEVAATRGCGSVFDSVVDRSGWELWWARDLDEPDEVRSALVRTTRCPDAVNQRVAIAAALGITALVLGAVAMARRRTDRSADPSASPIGRRVVRIGRLTSALGGALTALGIVAIVILVADADSTLFLYTDRLVVAVVGLIVLIPTITLFVIGRVFVLLGGNVRQDERDRSDG
jgi:uncharacterized membrane protein